MSTEKKIVQYDAGTREKVLMLLACEINPERVSQIMGGKPSSATIRKWITTLGWRSDSRDMLGELRDLMIQHGLQSLQVVGTATALAHKGQNMKENFGAAMEKVGKLVSTLEPEALLANMKQVESAWRLGKDALDIGEGQADGLDKRNRRPIVFGQNVVICENREDETAKLPSAKKPAPTLEAEYDPVYQG